MSLRNAVTCFWTIAADPRCFPFGFLFSRGNGIKVARGHVGTVMGLGDHRRIVTGQKVGNDKGRVAGSRQLRNSNFFPAFRQHFRRKFRAHFAYPSVTIPCTTNVDTFRVSADLCWMLNGRSERTTSRTRFTFSSVLAIVGRPERGSSAIFHSHCSEQTGDWLRWKRRLPTHISRYNKITRVTRIMDHVYSIGF